MPRKQPLRIVVTGSIGQVARALRSCSSENTHVISVGRPVLDLAAPDDPVRIFAALKPDVIVNAAAYTTVDKAESEPELAQAINARGAGLVAAAAAQLGTPVIQVSTDYVFDGRSKRPYREDDATGPANHYGATKLDGEKAVAAATQNHLILRTSWVYTGEGNNFMLTMLRLAQERKVLSIVADQHGAPTLADDIASTIVVLARQLVDRPDDASLRGTFHFTNSGETTWAGFASEIFKMSALNGGPSAEVRPITTAEYPTLARRPESSRLDLSKIASIANIRPRHWAEALRVAIEAKYQTKTPINIAGDA